jgi:A/G-specific adenine glycosylase
MPDVAKVQARVLEWYAANARDLPWRRTRDAYAILVAEVMLQQTQVDRVIPKWLAWLARFPTLLDLAQASRADAIRAWQGLGYNLRAVRLHAIAAQVTADHGGQLPRDGAELLRLKGIGRYTAGAVACFAYEQPVAMVDTNVRRVLSRVFGWPSSAVEALAESVVPASAAYAWNQALMDLGATLCRAKEPLCLACPLVGDCGGPRGLAGLPASAARRRAPARSSKGAAGPFLGSRRYHRGRIIQTLRELPAGESMHLSEFGDRRELVAQLAADGLVRIDADERVRLAD